MRVLDVMMDGGPLDDDWMVRNELNVRHELKARDLCQQLHKTNMVHRTWVLIVWGVVENKPEHHLEAECEPPESDRGQIVQAVSELRPKWEGMDMCTNEGRSGLSI